MTTTQMLECMARMEANMSEARELVQGMLRQSSSFDTNMSEARELVQGMLRQSSSYQTPQKAAKKPKTPKAPRKGPRKPRDTPRKKRKLFSLENLINNYGLIEEDNMFWDPQRLVEQRMLMEQIKAARALPPTSAKPPSLETTHIKKEIIHCKEEKKSQAPAQEEEDKCSICQEQFTWMEKYGLYDNIKYLQCIHKFHRTCINEWLRTKPTCPICKERAR